jgi:hypothetical protein
MIPRKFTGFLAKRPLLCRSNSSMGPIQRSGAARDVDTLPGRDISQESYWEDPSSPSPPTPPHASSPRLRAPVAGPSSSRHPRGHAVADADEECGEAAGPIPARWASASLAPATSQFPIFPSQPLKKKKIPQADGLDAVCVCGRWHRSLRASRWKN